MNWLWKSCYDFRWYGEQRTAPRGRAVLVFLSLALALAASRIAILGPIAGQGIEKGVGLLRKEIPRVTIAHGAASTTALQPWSHEFSGGFGLVIDTTGKMGLEKYAMGILLTRNQLVIKEGDGRTESLDLSKIEAFDSQGPQIDLAAAKARRWLYPVLTSLLLALSLAGLGLRWLATALIVFLIAQSRGVNLDWGQSSRMAAFALAPASYVALLGLWTPLRVMLLPSLTSLFLVGVSVWILHDSAGAKTEAGREKA